MNFSRYLQPLQENHQSQGNTNHCGPYALAAILPLFRVNHIQGGSLAHNFNRLKKSGFVLLPGRIRNSATFPWGMVRALKYYNIYAKWQIFKRETDLISGISHDLVQVVLIGEVFKRYAHYLILVGYDEILGMGFIDPAFPNNSVRWIKQNQFFHQWRQYGCTCICIPVQSTNPDAPLR